MARRWLIGGAVAAGLATGGVALVLGPLGAPIVDAVADGRAVWRLGDLRVDGVSGASLGDLTARSATIADETGVWIEAKDVRVRWSPLALLSGEVRILSVEAAEIAVLRRPELGPPPPDDPEGGPRVRLETLSLPRIGLAEGVAGAAAVFAAKGTLSADDGALQAAGLSLARTDGGADSLALTYDGDPLAFAATLEAPEGGAFAALIGAPARIEAKGAGGAARVRGLVAGQEALTLDLGWTAQRWTATGALDLDAAPITRDLAERFGARLALEGGGGPVWEGDGAVAELGVETPRLTARFAGRVDAGLRPQGEVKTVARVDGRALALEGGAAAFDGVIAPQGQGLRAAGTMTLDALNVGLVALSGAGPLRATIDAKAIRFDAETGALAATGDDTPARLLTGASAQASGVYDRQRGRLALTASRIAGPRLTARVTGAWSEAGAAFEGPVELPALGAVLPEWRGAAAGRFRLAQTRADAPWTLSIEGRGARVVAGPPEPLDQLVGASPTFAANLTIIDGGVRLDRATIDGARLRAGARGPIRDGVLDLDVEASVRGPLRIGDATVSGAGDVTGRATGPIDAVRFEGRALLASVDVGGAQLSRATVDIASIPDATGARSGRLAVAGLFQNQPLSLTGTLGTDDRGLRLNDVAATWGGLDLRGALALGEAGPEANFAAAGALSTLLPGATGRIGADVQLRPGPDGAPGIALSARTADARFGETRLRRLDLTLQGPMSGAGLKLEADGRFGPGAPFRIAASGVAALEDGVALTLDVLGEAAGARIANTAPVTVSLRGGRTELVAPLSVGSGAARLTYAARGDALTAAAELENAPLSPLAAFAGEAVEGRATGAVRLSGAGARLTGEADVAVTGLRLARRAREPIDARFTGRLDDARIEAALTARSARGLSADASGTLDVTASAAPLRIARAPGGEGQARWRLAGPIGGVWAVLGPLDQQLEGDVRGEGQARLTEAGVTGDGAIAIADGRFEDRISGVRLAAIDARLAFDGAGATLERFTATDGERGRLTGQGRLEAGERAQLSLSLSDFRLVRRPEARARGDGDLTVSWRPEGATVRGELRLREAEARPVNAAGAAPIPEIAVTEINLPAGRESPEDDAPSRALPVRFDVAVRAPGRIFTRGRGLDAEWSLDARLTGTADEPRLFGAAELVRGQFSLAGRRFELDAGEITFAGDPLEAEIDVTATAETPDLVVTVAIEGEALDPRISLSSVPDLPEDEILPQVLFGRTADELSAVEAAQLAASLASLSGAASFDIAQAARAAVDLDRFDVRQDGDGILVTGGKYLSREVYLEVARGPLGATATRIEWEVRPQLMLVSSFLPEGEQRVAIRWRRDYPSRDAAR